MVENDLNLFGNSSKQTDSSFVVCFAAGKTKIIDEDNGNYEAGLKTQKNNISGLNKFLQI